MDWLVCAIVSVGLVGAVRAQASPTPSPEILGGPASTFTTYDGQSLKKGEFKFAALYNAGSVKDEKLTSKLMAREMPYRIILPARYSAEKSTERFPVVYLLHGLTGHYTNWTDKTKIAELASSQNFIIVTPEGEDGWYTDSTTKPNDKYESYIIKELIPEVENKFRTMTDRDHRAIAGLSMGGYGSIKFGLKYPEMFTVVGSFSGALGAASMTEKQIPGAIGRTIDAIFGVAGSNTRKSNDIFDLIRQATPEKIKALPFLYLDCGTEDFLFQNNRDFVDLLVEKKVPHEFRELPGAHNWTYWNAQVEEFLELAEKRFAASPGR
ncbi:MAG TPA: alpha/beta hydrolase family protein [Pyrinomonadaceae bacterium]|nr:alpha/beta hydrolase family protein [Pyrinomonadaceae bacterium]